MKDLIFIDISQALNATNSFKELNSIMLVDKDLEFETPTSDISLIDSIAGFLDMILFIHLKRKRRS